MYERASEQANKMGLGAALNRNGGLAGAGYDVPAPPPQRETTVGSMIGDLKGIAQRIENIAARTNAALCRLGAPTPPMIGQSQGQEIGNGAFHEIKLQGLRIRSALTDAEAYLAELEKHI